MPYSPEEIGDLAARIDAALVAGHANDWERRFLIDIRQRIGRHGTRTRLSDRQISKIEELLGRWKRREQGGAQPYAPQAGRLRPEYSRRRSRKRRGAFKREVRYLSNRFVRDFAIVTALLVAAGVFSRLPELTHAVSWTRSAGHPISRYDFTVTDGDTIHLKGEVKGMRLVGFNAPEVFSPHCSRERGLGYRATARLEELVASSDLELEKVPCACLPGTEGTYECNYGRSCGILRANGEDIGRILISEGLAVPYVCGITSCPPKPSPWCK